MKSIYKISFGFSFGFIFLFSSYIHSSNCDTCYQSWSTQLKKATTFNSAGFSVHCFILDSIRHEVSIDIDFHFADRALNLMANDIKNDTAFKSFAENTGRKKTSSIRISRMILNWDSCTHSFISEGKYLNIESAGRVKLMRIVPGKLLFNLRKSGNLVKLLLEPDKSRFYVFTFQIGNMLVFSSNEKFNSIIAGKSDHAKSKTVNNKSDYRYSLGNRNDMVVILKMLTRTCTGN